MSCTHILDPKKMLKRQTTKNTLPTELKQEQKLTRKEFEKLSAEIRALVRGQAQRTQGRRRRTARVRAVRKLLRIVDTVVLLAFLDRVITAINQRLIIRKNKSTTRSSKWVHPSSRFREGRRTPSG